MDWKCAVRKRARIIKASAGQTGGGPPEKPLTNLEDTLLSLLERVAVEGMADTSELGVVDIDYKKYHLPLHTYYCRPQTLQILCILFSFLYYIQ
ncbi:hypothetical protein ILUMI_23375 [Ignelater luminosus]|uniref:Uncharacterized protein n=1 Tax=Ignelater luminosus TaxID=2038154 RepID=A0A8K0C916_IGNLU|nr:hypothetical protein ILUMI_23375 [Ignelater luminosus]